MSTQTESQNADRIKEEVRQVIRRLTELSQTSEDFDQFCDEVLGKLVEITGAHGALFWQITNKGVPRLTHHSGQAPHDEAREVLNPENEQHNRAILDVVRQKMPVGIMSEAFTGKANPDASSADSDTAEASQVTSPFLMLFSPVLNRQKDAVGAVELIQRGDISPQAQEGYLRFLTQIAALFQRWHERQENTTVAKRSEKWTEKMEFISEVHRSIDFKETAYAIANEARRVLGADRVSVGRWNGKNCKILAISSQDRFDNRANVVRKLGNVATASVGADSTFWVTGGTEAIAPEVAKKINDYLDESHSRTLAVIPLAIRPDDVPDLEMTKRNKKVRKLGAIVLEYFDDDVTEEAIHDDCQLVVEQSQLALENARKHGEIFLQPILKKLGWLQQTLFGDHLKKTLTGLAALALLTLAMIFLPWELKMKVDGVLHPETRRHVYSTSKGIIEEVNFEDGDEVQKDALLLKMVDYDRKQQMDARQTELKRIRAQADEAYRQMAAARSDTQQQARLQAELSAYKAQEAQTIEMIENDQRVMNEVLEVRAPIDGTIVTWNPQQRLKGLVVEPNQTLVTLSELDGQWQLEVNIPHNKVGYVDRALKDARDDDDRNNDAIVAEFALSTNPSKTYRGELQRVSIRPHTDESGIQKYRGIIKVEPDGLNLKELRHGAGATVKIHCGKVPLYKACFHQIIDWWQTNVWWF
ncbi:efflux RND transporter periplasmic adaptor subunit [Mariniblastus fucicola]|uniref:HlyD family secretion protein n=1 Tax=Mariniblastus fucicola TaxID=980251 RepID=A0A5B9PQI9_9BACT|nr:HlyD family efflux transporter periplasmic adaptor subunit [Mariniblastus fucicola]QEG24583.1 HlyD family secretion protein [Mariniblastus fucicola]